MAYSAAEARQELLDAIAAATGELAVALAALGQAYDELDEHTADRLEEELFRPLQAAYGRAQRTHTTFAQRHGLPARAFAQAAPPLGSRGVRALLERAVEAIRAAGDTLATLQDSMKPVEVGDAELRTGLADVRSALAPLPGRAAALVRVLGR
jgi:hypothetical protein